MMRSTTLFSIYAGAIVALILGFGWVTLYSLERARWWDARIQLAQESHSLHLQLEANVFRLFKQHGDALLIGDRDRGEGERGLEARIDQNMADIRAVIAREIEMVGEEEIEELELLEQMETDIRQVNEALQTISDSGEPLETSAQVERLADLLDREIDVHLTQLIDEALAEEIEEVEETLADAAAFRTWNQGLAYGLLLLAFALLVVGFQSFSRQIRAPLIRLKDSLATLRKGDYAQPVALGGSLEFRDLGDVLGDMASSLSERESSREEQQKHLEATVEMRTAELKRLIDRLELGEENRKRLMADISHELRTPLTIILGEAEVALRNIRGLSDETSDALARIRDSARHTNQIVDDMLTVARHEAGQLRLDRRDVDLRKILTEAAAMFPQDIALDMPSEPARLSVDDVRLRQSVLALFQNARRYGGPTIAAALAATPTGFRITVEDDGPGLSADEKRSAFDRFFRGSNASGQGIEGSGLGLPVVKSIVEAHGGQVTLADADNGGLRVRIDLPRHPAIRAVRTDLPEKRA
ncbi:MAG: HAMP domain-containing sensor histidine kinase [Pseudomonadota bacterium]